MSDKQAGTLTREELYKLVWSTPVHTLAKQFGISDRGLGKICARVAVPVPPRGYWARRAAGQKVVQYKLPPAPEGVAESVCIMPSPAPTAPAVLSSAIATVLQEQTQEREIAVAQTLANPHPIVRGWLDENKKSISQARRDPWGWKPEAIDDTVLKKRRLLILSALFKELERRGHKLKREDNYVRTVYAEINKQKVTFELEERIRQVRRQLTLKEQQEAFRDQKWRQDKVPTGKLRFRLTERYGLDGLRTEWLEDDQTPLENSLSEIVAVMIAAAAMLADREKKRREEEERRREEEHKRYQREQAAKQEESRWQHVMDMAVRWSRCGQIQAFLEAFERQAISQVENGALSPEQAEWFSWAKERLSLDDPMSYSAADLIAQNQKATAYDRPMQWAEDPSPDGRRRSWGWWNRSGAW